MDSDAIALNSVGCCDIQGILFLDCCVHFGFLFGLRHSLLENGGMKMRKWIYRAIFIEWNDER